LPIITPRTFRGTRDFLPAELLGRRKILKVIEEAYRKYGFQPLETPAIEYLEVLTGKSAENDKLIYEIKRARDGEDDSAESAIALRYDLTVPLARVVAQNPQLPMPFKRYQIQPVWRADRPQPNQGRYREFVQCDADIVGTTSTLADAEMIALAHEVFMSLGIRGHRIRISSRNFLAGVVTKVTQNPEYFIQVCRALDKLDKVGWEGVENELTKLGIDAKNTTKTILQHQQILDNIDSIDPSDYGSTVSSPVRYGLTEIKEIYERSLALGVPASNIKCDVTLVRGLDYYTGPIFETVLPELPHIGSLSGGGRYNGLIEAFSKSWVPATGMSLGLDRIQTALTQLGKFESAASETQVLVARFDSDGVVENLRIAALLRKEDLRVEIWYDDDRMKKQFSYADKQQIPLVVIAGPDERANGQVSLKNMRTGDQQKVSVETLAQAVRLELESLEV
jgi:histidyl-tRNA synthetase